ncbi:MAG: hypothetical protein AAGF11_54550 [Myxococcota bacterium]
MRLSYLVVVLGILGVSGCFEDIENNDSGPSAGSTDSTGGAASSSSGAVDSSSGESTGAEDPCPEYCGLVQDICEDDVAQYQSEAVCLAVCAALPPGMPGDQLGNSAECRRFQAIQAAEAPGTFCGPAGPTGDGTCGAACEVFCGLAMELCTDAMAQWPDVPTCITDCMQFPTDVVYNASVVDGDSYACRMYHLTVAALDPVVHCPHIPLASPPCM